MTTLGRISFAPLTHSTLGFERFFDDVERLMNLDASKIVSNFPPHNILKLDDNVYVVELAVAGFAKTDIEITLEGNNLVVKGSAKELDLEEGTFIHKGIANRNFTREFKLADKIEIKDAELTNGMLKIWLENMIKAQDLIKKIPLVSKDE